MTRQAVSMCAAVVFGDASFHESLAMACAELLENGIKYGSASAASLCLDVREEGREVVLAVVNAVDERSSHPSALRERIAWLHSHPDARAAYLAALARVYESGDPDSAESGLGIVRVAYEARSVIECDTTTPGLVVVRARFAHPSRAAGAPEPPR
jgi:hypothetical protein